MHSITLSFVFIHSNIFRAKEMKTWNKMIFFFWSCSLSYKIKAFFFSDVKIRPHVAPLSVDLPHRNGMSFLLGFWLGINKYISVVMFQRLNVKCRHLCSPSMVQCQRQDDSQHKQVNTGKYILLKTKLIKLINTPRQQIPSEDSNRLSSSPHSTSWTGANTSATTGKRCELEHN